MINEVIDAIILALDAEFGDDYHFYTENIEQNLEEPCFLVSCISPTIKAYPSKRYLRNNQFSVQYFPKNADSMEECNAVSERLFWCLECIGAEESYLRGTSMHAEQSDGVLNFFVNYDFFVRSVEEKAAMEQYIEKQQIKK